MSKKKKNADPFNIEEQASLKHWGEKPKYKELQKPDFKNVSVDCGWGKLILGQTYDNPEDVIEDLKTESPGSRDIALYVRDPHIVVGSAPQDVFLDPSLTMRLNLLEYEKSDRKPRGFYLTSAKPEDEAEINRVYLAQGFVPFYEGFLETLEEEGTVHVVLAKREKDDEIIGVAVGVDHKLAFDDPDNGSSLWSLAVDPQASVPGVGIAISEYLLDFYKKRGRTFLDLSVMHGNSQAIALYEKLGFEQIPVFCIKRRNPINEKLFLGPDVKERLNIYAQLIVDEARRRGISVEILDADWGYFRLTLGGRSIICRESLCELASAIAFLRCDNKRMTWKILKEAGLNMPEQIVAKDEKSWKEFLREHKRLVVKPVRGEQGKAVFVDISDEKELKAAIERCEDVASQALIERYVPGEDLRIIVINNEVVACATRRPAAIEGTGKNTIKELIKKQNRRRMAATDGESRIPVDDETLRAIKSAGYGMDDILPEGQILRVRKTANLHTGGTIHDVTDIVHPTVKKAAEKAAAVLEIPVVGFDLILPDIQGNEYVFIEANERPGLANHEPQPTAEKFIDLLFPDSKSIEGTGV